MKRKKCYFIFSILIGMAVFFSYLEKPAIDINKPQTPDQSYSDGETSFVQSVEQKPYRSEWKSSDLLQKMFVILKDPSLDIASMFSDTLTKSPDDQAYYLGAYTLSDGVVCKLLWLSNTDNFSVGATFLGDAESVAVMENLLKNELGKPSQEETENNTIDFYWVGKKYRQKDYTITVKKTTDIANHTITLDITMHPQIYH